jgi:redox-sensitive bicupin YhaK (pirin superfamily)
MNDIVLGVQPLEFVWRTADPFLFCVHHRDDFPAGDARLAPRASLAGRRIGQDFARLDGWNMYHGQIVPGFPQHPHRGFETVTLVRRGLVDHADSLGATGRFGGGDAQWMTAGKGVVHSEMFPLVRQDAGNPLELFQIWLNLPSADKMVAPHYTMLWSEEIPTVSLKDADGRAVDVTTIAGRFGDASPPAPPPRSWASRDDSDVAIWTIRLSPGAAWAVPPARPGTNRTLYFFAGDALQVDGRSIPPGSGVAVRPEAPVPLRAGDGPVELVLLQGRPIGEPVAQYGPFVMNTQQEIRQAFEDYQRTRFGGWPWERDDPVHGLTEGRFARHADGRIERRG